MSLGERFVLNPRVLSKEQRFLHWQIIRDLFTLPLPSLPLVIYFSSLPFPAVNIALPCPAKGDGKGREGKFGFTADIFTGELGIQGQHLSTAAIIGLKKSLKLKLREHSTTVSDLFDVLH